MFYDSCYELFPMAKNYLIFFINGFTNKIFDIHEQLLMGLIEVFANSKAQFNKEIFILLFYCKKLKSSFIFQVVLIYQTYLGFSKLLDLMLKVLIF